MVAPAVVGLYAHTRLVQAAQRAQGLRAVRLLSYRVHMCT
jgi:hypothetical protein